MRHAGPRRDRPRWAQRRTPLSSRETITRPGVDSFVVDLWTPTADEQRRLLDEFNADDDRFLSVMRTNFGDDLANHRLAWLLSDLRSADPNFDLRSHNEQQFRLSVATHAPSIRNFEDGAAGSLLRFSCFACGKRIKARPSVVGGSGPCPHCGCSVTVPQPIAVPPAMDCRTPISSPSIAVTEVVESEVVPPPVISRQTETTGSVASAGIASRLSLPSARRPLTFRAPRHDWKMPNIALDEATRIFRPVLKAEERVRSLAALDGGPLKAAAEQPGRVFSVDSRSLNLNAHRVTPRGVFGQLLDEFLGRLYMAFLFVLLLIPFGAFLGLAAACGARIYPDAIPRIMGAYAVCIGGLMWFLKWTFGSQPSCLVVLTDERLLFLAGTYSIPSATRRFTSAVALEVVPALCSRKHGARVAWWCIDLMADPATRLRFLPLAACNPLLNAN